MTNKRLEEINRKTRILNLVKAGEKYAYIALVEKCCTQHVSRLALSEGIRKQADKTAKRWQFLIFAALLAWFGKDG